MSARQRKPPANESSNPAGPPAGWQRPPATTNCSLAAVVSCFLLLLVSVGMFCVFYFPDVRVHFGVHSDETLNWWQRTIVYQVYPRSFQDSNGDGTGDLPGLTSRLDYFTFLGVEAIWLSPIYRSPMVDHGYDVSNYIEIDPIFGNLDDFKQLITEAHERGIKVIMDFIPNHTSDQHPWFQSSRQAQGRLKDFYIWADGRQATNGTVEPPNNWVSVFGGSMWEWDEKRGQFYLHQFAKEQPDLNIRNPDVKTALKGVLEFWLNEGVDGFRVDAAMLLIEAQDLSRNEPPFRDANPSADQYKHYDHLYTKNLADNHDVIREWRVLFDEHEERTGKEIFMVLEIFDDDAQNVIPYYQSGASFPFNFNLQHLNLSCDGFCIKQLVDSWLTNIPEGKWPNWVLGSHDVSRISEKMGTRYSRALNMLLLTLPGTPTTYYGEELGMRGVKVAYQDTQDPFAKKMGPEQYQSVSRDPSRAPMQWSDAVNAGFSAGPRTWLPVHPDYRTRNVQAQMKDNTSPLRLYQQLAELRRVQSFSRGKFSYALVNKNIFSFIRHLDNEPAHLIALNLGDAPSIDDYREYKNQLPADRVQVPYRGYVVATTGNMAEDGLNVNDVVTFDSIALKPGEGVIIRYWPAMTYV